MDRYPIGVLDNVAWIDIQVSRRGRFRRRHCLGRPAYCFDAPLIGIVACKGSRKSVGARCVGGIDHGELAIRVRGHLSGDLGAIRPGHDGRHRHVTEGFGPIFVGGGQHTGGLDRLTDLDRRGGDRHGYGRCPLDRFGGWLRLRFRLWFGLRDGVDISQTALVAHARAVLEDHRAIDKEAKAFHEGRLDPIVLCDAVLEHHVVLRDVLAHVEPIFPIVGSL